jgi:tetratricopeptide (TPR) repeat protein
MRPSTPILFLSFGAAALGVLSTSAFAQTLAEVDKPDAAALVQERSDAAVHAQALIDRDSYQQTIATLEARQGVYSMELSEAYVGLGNTLRTLDQHEEAAAAFSKALQSLRIGYGLNDLRQLAVLEELRTTHERLGDWDEVDSANHLIFYIAKHSPEADEDLRVKALLNLGDWMRKAEAEELVSDFDANARDLMELYNSEIARIQATENYAGRNVHLATLYLDLAATELSEAKRKYEMPLTAFQTPAAGEQRTTTQQSCVTGVDRSGRVVQACTQPMEVPNINYYLAPNQQKSTEIRVHLAAIENTVLQAYRALQDEPSDATPTELLDEVHRLTTEYNDFVALNKSRPF